MGYSRWGMDKVQSFEQLLVWQESQNLAVAVYSAVRNFPEEEKFGITSQLKRASSSVSANIAEGFGRKSTNDKLHFYAIAYGSLLETKNFIYLAKRLKYLLDDQEAPLINQVISCQKLLNAYTKAHKSWRNYLLTTIYHLPKYPYGYFLACWHMCRFIYCCQLGWAPRLVFCLSPKLLRT